MRRFYRSLYEEHVEELAFLYAQRCAALTDPAWALSDLFGLEARLEANLDALVLGGEWARQVCQEQLGSDDVGALYGAVRVLARHQAYKAIGLVVAALDCDDGPRWAALGEALLAEAVGPQWAAPMDQWLQQLHDPRLQATLARVAGLRGLPVGESIHRVAQSAPEGQVGEAIVALGRLGFRPAEMLFYRYLQGATPANAQRAALAALRLGNTATRAKLVQYAGQGSWAALPLALAGHLLEAKRLGLWAADDPSVILALGLHGGREACEVLVQLLTVTASAEQAAAALDLVTGAGGLVEVPVEASALSGSEDDDGGLAVRWQQQTAPEYWRQQLGELERRGHWANERPVTAQVILQALQNTRLPLEWRESLADGLALRFAEGFGYAPYFSVIEQQRACARFHAWIHKGGGDARHGRRQ